MSSSTASEPRNYPSSQLSNFPQLSHLPSASPISPTSKTQSLLSPGSFPASESPVVDSPTLKPPVMTPGEVPSKTLGHAFELTIFSTQEDACIHSEPKVKATELVCSPMEKLFQKIKQNDRIFIQKLPPDRLEQIEQGFFIDQASSSALGGFTPLTLALTLGHLDLAVDLLLLGASIHVADAQTRQPLRIIANDSMAKLIITFMVLETNEAKSRKAKSRKSKSSHRGEYQKLLTQIDHQSGHTLLTWAIRYRHPKLVERLINAGADFRVYNRFGRAAFEEACAFGCMETLSLLLDAWPEVVVDQYREHLIAGIESAIVTNRRMVVAELLSFFRTAFRYVYKSASTVSSYDKEPKVPPNPVAEEEAFRLFLGAKPERTTSVAHLIKQTSDTFLLAADESRLLQLSRMVALAQKRSLPEIVEIIRAHAIISDDDTHSDSSSV